MIRLPVEVSEGQLTEELIAGKQTKTTTTTKKTHYKVQISVTHSVHSRVTHRGYSCKQDEAGAGALLLTVVLCSAPHAAHTGRS